MLGQWPNTIEHADKVQAYIHAGGFTFVWWPTNPQATRMGKAHLLIEGEPLCGARKGYGVMTVKDGDWAELCKRCLRSM